MDMLIGAIYDSVLAPSLTVEAVEELRRLLGAFGAWVIVPQSGGRDFDVAAAFEVRINLPEDIAATYLRSYRDKDPLLLAHLADPARTTNVALRNCDMVPDQVWTSAEPYAAVLLPARIGHLLCAVLVAEGGAPARVLSFGRPPEAPQFSVQDRAIFQIAIPHLLRAARLRHEFARRA